jgi:phage/conjugal plasmid C-4 type zinc finger TraR family protein
MADEIDRAQHHNELHQAIALAAVRSRLSPGSAICLDCEETIPPKRRQAYPAAIRCIACQQDFEKDRGLRHGA